MNVLFLTLLDFNTLGDGNIYSDLLLEFADAGHHVYVVSPTEKRHGIKTHVIKEDKGTILKLQIGNIQKTNIVEKGISTLLLESQFVKGIKKYFKNIKFDLVLYSTPPITLCRAIEFVKNRDKAKTYLLLKDIFPQNSVDLGLLSKSGVKGFLYKFFRAKEQKLYRLSDKIGCMSPANAEYLLRENPYIEKSKVEVCPNSMRMDGIIDISHEEKIEIRKKYSIPQDKKVFIYGGNFGKPQCVPFILECLSHELDNEDVYFLLSGNGTEYKSIEEFVENNKNKNVRLMEFLPRAEFNRLTAACDVGLIFLDSRFTIPNFPSRLLSYMAAGIPTMAVTDDTSDVGDFLSENEIGVKCKCGSIEDFLEKFQYMTETDFSKNQVFAALKNNYDTYDCYKKIMVAAEEKIAERV